MYNNKFESIVKDAKEFFINDLLSNCTNFYNECANRIIRVKDSNVEFSNKPYKKEDLEEGLKKVVIVLESPHIDEYIKNSKPLKMPICANGATGEKIKKYLCEILNKYLFKNNTEAVEVIVINAVKYQCSQGLFTEILRDFIWLKCWYDFGYSEMFNLLIEINPNVVINCCTKGSHFLQNGKSNVSEKYIKEVLNVADICNHNGIEFYSKKQKGRNEYSLRELVNNCLLHYQKDHKNVELYRCTHPCSWIRGFPKDEFKKVCKNE